MSEADTGRSELIMSVWLAAHKKDKKERKDKKDKKERKKCAQTQREKPP